MLIQRKFISITLWLAASFTLSVSETHASIQNMTLKEKLILLERKQTGQTEHFIFDLPVTYNKKVSTWISFFQTNGKNFFKNWLEKSSKYMPLIQTELKRAGLPLDLAYMVMIESGFNATAISSAQAVGPWQFISSTGKNYGLKQNFWLDERRDLRKSTRAAIAYMKDLHKEFGSWYLVAASYNMGEGGLRRQIRKHKTTDYWELVRKKALPKETQDYVPKILAAMMIAKAPNLYGFRSIEPMYPLEYEYVESPANTDLDLLADHLNVTRKAIRDLNAELILGYVPKNVALHTIRVPKGAATQARNYFRDQSKRYALE